MVRPRSRRDLLRAGASLAAATALAGCGGEDDGEAAASTEATPTPTDAEPTTTEPASADDARPAATGVPGVIGGEVEDARRLATAHHRTLQRRSGRTTESMVTLNRESGRVVRSGSRAVAFDGPRLFVAFVGENLGWVGADRSEVYVEGDAVYRRRLVDGEWDVERFTAAASETRLPRLTGRTRLELLLSGMTLVGEEAGDAERYLFRRRTDFGTDTWERTDATVDPEGVCHEWTRRTVSDGDDVPLHSIYDGHVVDLFDTTVSRPAWVDAVDG